MKQFFQKILQYIVMWYIKRRITKVERNLDIDVSNLSIADLPESPTAPPLDEPEETDAFLTGIEPAKDDSHEIEYVHNGKI